MKDYSSLINPRNKASNLTSDQDINDDDDDDEGDKKQRGGRTGKLVRFLERRRREAGEEVEVRVVEEAEPRMSGITIHTHHHFGQDLKVRYIEIKQTEFQNRLTEFLIICQLSTPDWRIID